MIAIGLTAGAAGTAALDLASYIDMATRGRAASELPATVVTKLGERLGLASFADAQDDASKNRRRAIGALLGYAVGLGGGVAYAALRPAFRSWLPWPIAGLIVGAATLGASEGSATALGATDWRTWSTAQWIADIVPRALYGLTVAATVEALMPEIDDETIALREMRATSIKFGENADLPYAAALASDGMDFDADRDAVTNEHPTLFIVDEERVI